MKIHALAALGEKRPLEHFTYDKDVGPDDVLISILYTSCARGDVRFIDNFWGDSSYPMVPGGEVVGVVKQKGRNVRGLDIGECVGVGYQVGACFKCEYCKVGKEQFCGDQRLLFIHEFGGYAEAMVVDHRFVFTLPKNLCVADATPLVSSGLTVYTAIKKAGVTSGMNVGVVGVGNLGHLAVQFLHTMGAHVTAFSHTPAKEKILKKLGATRFIASNDEEELAKFKRHYDFILFTSSGSLNWELFIQTLTPQGTLCFVGLPPEKISFKAELLADYAQRSIMGNYIGSRNDMEEMLQYASKKHILAVCEEFPMCEANHVVDQVRKGTFPFSVVLSNKK